MGGVQRSTAQPREKPQAPASRSRAASASNGCFPNERGRPLGRPRRDVKQAISCAEPCSPLERMSLRPETVLVHLPAGWVSCRRHPERQVRRRSYPGRSSGSRRRPVTASRLSLRCWPDHRVLSSARPSRHATSSPTTWSRVTSSRATSSSSSCWRDDGKRAFRCLFRSRTVLCDSTSRSTERTTQHSSGPCISGLRPRVRSSLRRRRRPTPAQRPRIH